jgi:hypothetical protein
MPSKPPKDIIEKCVDLWFKGLEISGRRAIELLVLLFNTELRFYLLIMLNLTL